MRINKTRPTMATPAEQENTGVFSWWKNRAAKKKEEEEAAAIAIIDKAIENETTFCNMLGSIDFRGSKLPKDKLNHKSPNNKSAYGDLEFMAKYIAQEIRKNPYCVSIDVRPLDKILYQIIRRYKEAVENGYPNQAFAGRVALKECFQKIRFRLPQVLPEGCEEAYSREYIKTCARHAESWLNMIIQARYADQAEENVDKQQKEHDGLAKESTERKEKYLAEARKDPVKLKALEDILSGKPFAALSPEGKAMYADVIEMRIQDIVLDVAKKQLQQNRIAAKLAQGRVKTLKTGLCNLNLPIDPNAMNKYNDEIEAIVRRMAEMDQEIEESIDGFEELQHKVAAMDDLPGAQAAREMAAQGVQNLFEQKAKEQNDKLAKSRGFSNLFEMFDVKTEEEMERLLEEQKENLEEEEELPEELEETEEELNYAE